MSAMNLPTLEICETGAGTLSFRQCGAGAQALLLLHGLGSGSASWERQLAHFAPALRVIAWEAPGYGRSEPLDSEAPEAAAYADALEALRLELRVERLHLVGHSMGGLIAAVYAARHPRAVRTLTLSHAAIGFGPLAGTERLRALLARLPDMEALGAAAFAQKFAPNLVAPAAPPDVLERVRTVMGGLNPAGYRQALHMLARSDIFPHLAAVQAPAIVLWGTADRIAPEADMLAMVQALPGAAYHVLPGVGHAPYLEAPEAYNALLESHLNAV